MKRGICLFIVLFCILSISGCTASMRPEKTELPTSTPGTTGAAASAVKTPASTPAYTMETSSPVYVETSFPAVEETKPGLEIGECVIEKDGYVYFLDGPIYKRNIKNNHKEVIWSNDSYAMVQQMFFGYDNEFYYLIYRFVVNETDSNDVYELYRHNPSGEDVLLIRDNDIRVLEINDKYIYLSRSIHDENGSGHKNELLRATLNNCHPSPYMV